MYDVATRTSTVRSASPSPPAVGSRATVAYVAWSRPRAGPERSTGAEMRPTTYMRLRPTDRGLPWSLQPVSVPSSCTVIDTGAPSAPESPTASNRRWPVLAPGGKVKRRTPPWSDAATATREPPSRATS